MHLLLRSVAAAVLAVLLVSSIEAADRPNVLIIMADDCTFSDLPLYGGQNAKTPNIDRLASEGLTFNKAYLSSAMCQPCRAELFSGQYPMRNGCAWNHSASRPETTSMPQGTSLDPPSSAFPSEPPAASAEDSSLLRPET